MSTTHKLAACVLLVSLAALAGVAVVAVAARPRVKIKAVQAKPLAPKVAGDTFLHDAGLGSGETIGCQRQGAVYSCVLFVSSRCLGVRFVRNYPGDKKSWTVVAGTTLPGRYCGAA